MGQSAKAGLPSNLTFELPNERDSPLFWVYIFHSSHQSSIISVVLYCNVIIKSQWGERSPGSGNTFIKKANMTVGTWASHVTGMRAREARP